MFRILPYVYMAVTATMICCLFCLLYKARKRIKFIIQSRSIIDNEEYLRVKLAVSTILKPKLSRIDDLCRHIISGNLHGSDEGIIQNDTDDIQAPEQELYAIFESAASNCPEKNYCTRAIRVFLKSNLISHPYDIRGNRRCFTAEQILDAYAKGQPCPQLRQKASKFRTNKWLSVKVYTSVWILSFGLWLYDIATDTQVGVVSIKVMCQLDVESRFCLPYLRNWIIGSNASSTIEVINENGTDLVAFKRYNTKIRVEDAEYLVSVMGIHNINYFIFYCLSLIISVVGNPWRKLSMLIATKFRMGRAQSEEDSAAIPPLFVLARHRLAIDEAGLEALLCMCLNVGTYLNLLYMMIEMPEVDNDDLKGILSARTIAISMVVSMASLTMAQMKSHDTQHEYNMTSSQKVVYFFATFFNNLSFCHAFAASYAFCMFWCCNMYFTAEMTAPRFIFGFFMNGVVCVFFAGFIRVTVSWMNNFIFRKELKAMQETDTTRAFVRAGRLFNSAEVFQLPTSNTHVNSYNSIYSVQLLLKFSRQCCGYLLILCQGLFQFVVIFVKFKFDLERSNDWIALFSLTIILMPLGYFASYLMLWWYFKLDYGYFSEVNVQFIYEDIPAVSAASSLFMEKSQEYIDKLEKKEKPKNYKGCGEPLREIENLCQTGCLGREEEFSGAGYWKEFPIHPFWPLN